MVSLASAHGACPCTRPGRCSPASSACDPDGVTAAPNPPEPRWVVIRLYELRRPVDAAETHGGLGDDRRERCQLRDRSPFVWRMEVAAGRPDHHRRDAGPLGEPGVGPRVQAYRFERRADHLDGGM